MNKLQSLFFLLLFVLAACQTEETKDDKLSAFFERQYSLTNLEQYAKVIVVNEMGHCMDCNNTFSETVSRYTDNSAYLFLVSTPGMVIDISEFLKQEQANILYDSNATFNDLEIITNCAIIDLKKGKIDKIMNVTNENISEIRLEH